MVRRARSGPADPGWLHGSPTFGNVIAICADNSLIAGGRPIAGNIGTIGGDAITE